MKLRFITSIGNALGGFVEGTIIEPSVIGPIEREWLKAGVAVIHRDAETEVAALETPERAVLPQRRARRRRAPAVA